MSDIAKVQAKLVAAQNCHPGAVQTLIAEALDALDEFSRSQIGRQPPMVLTGYQLRDALEFVAPDDIDEQLEQSVCIALRDNVKDEESEKVLPAGLFVWLEEYPDEGLLPLDGEPVAKSRHQQAEKELRKLLCVAYAGVHAHMDDGEAQDSRANPTIDFMRDTPAEIMRKMQQRSLAQQPHHMKATDGGPNLLNPNVRHKLATECGYVKAQQPHAEAVPQCWPTYAMVEAGRKAAASHGPLLGNDQSLWHIFRDMHAAAPKRADAASDLQAVEFRRYQGKIKSIKWPDGFWSTPPSITPSNELELILLAQKVGGQIEYEGPING